MIILPWYVRLVIDTAIIFTPFVYLHHHPTTHLFEYFEDKRRVQRRRTVEEQNGLFGEKESPYMSKDEAKQFYKSLGMEYERS